MVRRFVRFLFCSVFHLLFFLLTRVHVQGKENIPSQGGYLAAANHLSVIEVPLVYCLLNRDDASGLVAKKHQNNPLFRWLANAIKGIWINREEIDTRALRAARDHLKGGGVLGIAPEGTRSGHGRLQRGLGGVVFLALHSGAPLLPLVYYGAENYRRDWARLRRPDFHIVVGQPFHLQAQGIRVTGEVRQQMTDEIMYQLAALLPPAYRGEYANLAAATETYLRFPPPSESNLRRAQGSALPGTEKG